jgi:hypothetical protein
MGLSYKDQVNGVMNFTVPYLSLSPVPIEISFSCLGFTFYGDPATVDSTPDINARWAMHASSADADKGPRVHCHWSARAHTHTGFTLERTYGENDNYFASVNNRSMFGEKNICI